MSIHVDENRRVWLSYVYLVGFGISEKAIEHWRERNTGTRMYIDGLSFIDYDTIPKPTQIRLKGKEALIIEAREQGEDTLENQFFNQLEQAYSGIATAKWYNLITEAFPSLNKEDAITFSKRAAVIEKALELNPYLCGNLSTIYKAYLRIYKNSYSTKRRFCMMLKDAERQGIVNIAVDKRAIRKHEPIHGEDVQYWAAYILNHNKAFSKRMSFETFTELCEKQKCKAPSYRWFLSFYHTNKNTLDKNRYGQAEFERLSQNYAKIIPALYAGDQWQMDGWRIPIYCKKRRDDGKIGYFATYNLFAVMDAHSRRIIGYDIAESENTQTILKSIEKAVKETLTLPYEIVADNHSFNQTKEAGNLKADMDSMGVTWTIDSNPRRKSIMERSFKTLGEKHFKKQYGYIGQGIRSKEKGGITQQELKDMYTKPDNFLTYDQVSIIALSIILEYNSSRILTLQDSPNSLYEKSERPHAIKVDDFQRLRLFTLKGEYKISHGQITIQRGAHRHEFQLPAQYAQKHNNQNVTVRYADFDSIYLYDLKTDIPICSVLKKMEIHGALANQTEKDKELLFKNKGRIQGINASARNQKEKWYNDAVSINPDAYEAVNQITTPKDILEELRVNHELRSMAIDLGINPDTVEELPRVSEMLDPSMRPPVKKVDRHPFHSGESHIKIFNPNN